MLARHMKQRGIIAVRASQPNEIAGLIKGLTTDFAEFKASQQREIDELNSKLAAASVGAGLPENVSNTRALSNLGEFARSGSVEALTRGLTVQAAMSVGSDPDGGYTVPQELSQELFRVQRDNNPFRRLARVVSTKATDYDQPISIGGTGTGWVGETAARPETNTPTLANINIPSGEIYANPAITQKMLDDSAFNIGEFITEEISAEFDAQEMTAFVSGNGTNKPAGFLTGTITNESDSARAFGTLQYVASGAAAAVSDADKLIDLVYALRTRYRQNGAWLMNSTTAATIRKMKDGDGNYLWQRALVAGQPESLLGYPVETVEAMPDIAADAYPIAFGDWQRGYTITDRVGVRILRDPFTNKPYVHFYTTKRVGGKVIDSNAIKLLKVAAS